MGSSSNLTLIADDRTIVREGIAALFAERGMTNFALVSIENAPKESARLHPKLLMLGMGGGDAEFWSVVQTLRQESPRLKILILDDLVSMRNVRRTLSYEVSGYWTLRHSFASLFEAVKTLADGDCAFCPEVKDDIQLTKRGWKYHPRHEANPIHALTSREMEIFLLLAKGKTLKECAAEMEIAVSTADNHKARLMNKLGKHKTVQLVHLALQEGLIDDVVSDV